MKNLLNYVIASLLCLSSLQAQDTKDSIKKNIIKYGEVSMEVTVDSLEEINTVFQQKDLTDLIDDTDINENISFKITCNRKPMSNRKKSHISYKVFGNSNEPKKFIASVNKILESAKKYYSK